MKKCVQFLLSGFFLLIASSAFTQKKSDILSEGTPLVYLGVDFSKTKVINDIAATTYDIKTRHFPGINQVVIAEPKKFDWPKYLERGNITNDIAAVTAINEKIDEKAINSSSTADETHLKEADIQGMVNKYDLSGKKGVGLVIIMEALSKTSESASMYITFIDLSSKKVLHTERMVEKAGGFGFRNYYASTIFKAMQSIKKSKLKSWRSSFGS
ncbi:hypothetical protein [Flavihumibacter sp. UBA7668]|uniref:hypothetical protein n=1 Tax=Flavihumibacter sp. UBA7668 TaxID=1946542 RepID=UPI0025C1F18F|nr:hypothetical protein [Flavihumibacter sp. UBA7668]